MAKSVKTESTIEVLGADDHDMSQDMISNNALKVLNRLIDGGFDAFLVGGGVRDALVGQRPKDFDVATDASPEEVRELFRNSRIIGRRFRLVHVLFGRDVIEVATFRAGHDKGDGGEVGDAGQIVRDNVFGSVEEDAIRRDFSVNALYYNIANDSITDYCGGLNDMRDGVFRLIGDPITRCEEDPVRVLRAARLSAKLNFEIHKDTLAAMEKTRHALAEVPAARLFEEMLKLFQGGYAENSFNSVREHGLLPYLFPLLAPRLENDTVGLEELLTTALQNTDARVAAGKPITPYYLLSFMLWPDVEQRARMHVADGMAVADAIGAAADSVTAEQVRIIAIPRRISEPMREVWALQLLLEHGPMEDLDQLIQNRRFRAAYDFLLLRATIDERLQPLAEWWTEIQRSHNEVREQLIENKPVIEGYWGESPEQLENLVVPVPPSNDRKNSRDRNRKPRQRGGQSRDKNASSEKAPAENPGEQSSQADNPGTNDGAGNRQRGQARSNSGDNRGNSRGPRSNNRNQDNDNAGNRQRPQRRQSAASHENWDDDNRGNRAVPDEPEDTYTIYDDIQPEHNANRDTAELLGVQGQAHQRGGRRRPHGNNQGQARRRNANSHGNANGNASNAGSGQPRRKKRSARRRPDNAQANNAGNGQGTQASDGQAQRASGKKTASKKGGGQGMNGQRRRRSRTRRPRSGGESSAPGNAGGSEG